MRGSRSRSVEAAVLQNCCCLKQKNTPECPTLNQETTGSTTRGHPETPLHLKMRMPLGVLQVVS